MSEQFGEVARNNFYLEDGKSFTNHGSYGTVPKQVMRERFRLLEKFESHPDRFMRSELRPLYDESRVAVAEYVGANPDNLVFVTNATAAVNTVVKELDLGPEDIILCNSHTYGACFNAADSAARRAGADIVRVDISFPIRNEMDVVEKMVETCRRNVGIKLAIIDHISSPSALVFPVAELTRQLHDLGVLVLIDGAHAPGQLDLNVEEIGADFYTGNLHKWCYAPKGCAFLWVSNKFRSALQPLVTSWLYKQDLQDQFFMQGTMDYTPYLVAKTALQFYSDQGGREALVRHTTPLLDWAQQMLCHSLNTTLLPVPHNMVAPFMRVLRLPSHEKYPVSRDTAEKLMKEILTKSNVVVAIVAFSSHLWLRISANCYSTKQDFIQLKEVLSGMFLK